MSPTDKERIIIKVQNLFRNEYTGHIMFWTILYALFLVLDDFAFGFWFAVIKELVNISFFVLIVYINLYYLIPRYLSQKNVAWYLSLLVLIALVITPIKALCLYLLYNNAPNIQSFLIENQSSIFLSTFFLGGVSTIYQIMNDWVRHQRERQELENRNLKSELNFLKSQINPHFLFNTLNNLYALTLKKSDKAPETVLKLSEMMRYMLYECNEDRVPLYKEVNYLRNYLELEKLRQGKNIKIDINLEGEVSNQRIAPLMFIPFVENSFKHGLSNHLSQGYIDIRLIVADSHLELSVENSKANVVPSGIQGNKKSGGIGLINIKKRLQLLYPERYTLEIKEEPNKYKVTLNLELK